MGFASRIRGVSSNLQRGLLSLASVSRHNPHLVASRLKSRFSNVYLLIPGSSASTRNATVFEFRNRVATRDGDKVILCADPRCATAGLNLPVASHIFLLHPLLSWPFHDNVAAECDE